jgi:hypothetical protein
MSGYERDEGTQEHNEEQLCHWTQGRHGWWLLG